MLEILSYDLLLYALLLPYPFNLPGPKFALALVKSPLCGASELTLFCSCSNVEAASCCWLAVAEVDASPF